MCDTQGDGTKILFTDGSYIHVSYDYEDGYLIKFAPAEKI